MPVTFAVSNTTPTRPPSYVDLDTYVSQNNNGHLLRTTQASSEESKLRRVSPPFKNGFVGAAFQAYNMHYHLVLRPDDIWIAITTALASFIDTHAEEMRSIFVSHEGKEKLVVFGSGNRMSADYPDLIDQLTTLIDQKTKDNIRDWIECNFSTSDPASRTVSKLVLMGALKHYFSYGMCLMCGLPGVTLKGTIEDWKTIRTRVDRLTTWNIPELSAWSVVLANVLDQFVGAFEGKIDTSFWNRIAHQTGGGSGPRYLEGWILAFIPFVRGNYILNDVKAIQSTNCYGRLDTNRVPCSAVQVPVTINDNGTEIETFFVAGAIVSAYDADTNQMRPALDWALFQELTDAEKRKLEAEKRYRRFEAL
jgi:hypothetical protein